MFQLRQFSRLTSRLNKVIPEAPDWSPTATENDSWLHEVGKSNPSTKIIDDYDKRFKNWENNEVIEPGNYNEYLYPSEDNVEVSTKWSNVLSTGKINYKFLPKEKHYYPQQVSIPLKQFKHLRTSQFSSSKHRPKSTQNFSDIRIIQVKSGKGGNGAVSFFRDAGRPVGPPDGGDGGDGGSVYIQAAEGISSLHKIKMKYEAGDGMNGAGRQLDGIKGDDIIITVPVGTTLKWLPKTELLKQVANEDEDIIEDDIIITVKDELPNPKYFQLERYTEDNPIEKDNWIFKDKEAEFHESKDWFIKLNKTLKKYERNLMNSEHYEDIFPIDGIDLSKPTPKPILLLKGGKGGLGNIHFLTKEIRNPRFSKRGRESLSLNFLLELKLLADFGLIGLPNSGKSTLLNSMSNANSKVGHWAFTTLQPTLGTVVPKKSSEIFKDNFSVADIPGIIKGAADPINPKGMGAEFLRHIERSKILMFVISIENDPINDFEILFKELTMGKDRILGKSIIVVATKCDLSKNSQVFKKFKDYIRDNFSDDCPILPVCAIKRQNIDKLIQLMNSLVDEKL